MYCILCPILDLIILYSTIDAQLYLCPVRATCIRYIKVVLPPDLGGARTQVRRAVARSLGVSVALFDV